MASISVVNRAARRYAPNAVSRPPINLLTRNQLRMNVKAIVNSNAFGRAILGVIVFNAVLIGMSTYRGVEWVNALLPTIHTLEWVCIWIFWKTRAGN